MEKRLVTAIVVSILVILGWSALTSKLYHVDNKEVATQSLPGVSLPAQPAVPVALPVPKKPIPPSFVLPLVKQEIGFDAATAAIKDVTFKQYQEYKFSLQSGLWLAQDGLSFSRAQSIPPTAVFSYADLDKKIDKEFIFSNADYSAELNVSIENMSNLPLNLTWPIVLGRLDFSDSKNAPFHGIVIATNEKTQHFDGRKEITLSPAKFIALRNRYFCAILEPAEQNYAAFIRKAGKDTFEVGLQPLNLTILPKQRTELKFHIYLGPQDLGMVKAIKPEWAAVVYYGMFDFISKLLLQGLEIIHRLVRNWGIAIIVLSVLVYLLLYPLSMKQMRSMKEMQALQPHIDELRIKYKDSPQKLNKEIMELYRLHKVNPLGGCLPLILQLPIFFALYQAIMRSVALKGAQFLWIKDLSEPDRLLILPTTLPLLGNELNILPILMAIGMFVQQKFSMTATGSAASAQQQKMMLIMMPVIFGFVFYHMPAALVLYWFVNSALMLIYQIRLGRAK